MIRHKTYRNFMRVVRQIEAKGWSFDEAVKTAHRIFDDYEACPDGLSVEARVKMVMEAER